MPNSDRYVLDLFICSLNICIDLQNMFCLLGVSVDDIKFTLRMIAVVFVNGRLDFNT